MLSLPRYLSHFVEIPTNPTSKMDANELRLIKKFRDVLDYGTLHVTQKYLVEIGQAQLAQRIARMLANNKIDKPIHHNKIEERHTNYYRVDLSAEDIEIIVSMFGDKEASAIDVDSETSSAASFYASLLDKWHRLIT